MKTVESELARLRSRRNHYARKCERLESENGMLVKANRALSSALRKVRSKFTASLVANVCCGLVVVFVIGSQMAVLHRSQQPIQYAAEPTFDYTSPARVLASVRIGQSGGCSGTIIHINGEKAYGVSAAHCCSGVGQTFVIGNPDGTSASARWTAINREHDLALFVTWASQIIAACPVAEAPDYDTIDACGYPAGNGPIYKRATYNGDRQGSFQGMPSGATRAYYTVTEGWFQGGDSGGGVFADGRLVGVISHGPRGSDPVPTPLWGSTHEQLMGFLKRELGNSGFS